MKFLSISCLLNLDPHVLEFEMEKRNDEVDKLVAAANKLLKGESSCSYK